MELIMGPTPARNNLTLPRGDFANLAQGLDYAARDKSGYNFYDGVGKISAVLSYNKLQKEAQSLARRLLGLGPRRGARVALVIDTHPDFMRYFFACQYAGLVPIPLPAPIQLEIGQDYGRQLRQLLHACKAEIAIASESYLPYLMKAAASLDLSFYGGTKAFIHLPEEDVQLSFSGSDELAYLQFTSVNSALTAKLNWCRAIRYPEQRPANSRGQSPPGVHKPYGAHRQNSSVCEGIAIQEVK